MFKHLNKFYCQHPCAYSWISIIAVFALAISAIFYAGRNDGNPFETVRNHSPSKDSVIIAGEETNADANLRMKSESTNSEVLHAIDFQEIQDSTASFEKYAFISGDLVMDRSGIVRIKANAINSNQLKRYAIEAKNIDGNSITSRTIKNNTIQGEDISKNANLNISSLSVSGDILPRVDNVYSLGSPENRFKDLYLGSDSLHIIGSGGEESSISYNNEEGYVNFSTDSHFDGDLTVEGVIYGSLAGSFAPTGDVNMANHIITNIGNAGTDFTASGGLNLAGTLAMGNNAIDGTNYDILANGNITAGTYNGLTVTSTTGTFTISNGKVLTVSDSASLSTNSITLAGGEMITFSPTNAFSLLTTGATSVTFPTSGTLYGTATGSITSLQLATSLSDETGSGALVFGTSPTFTTSVIMSDGATLGQSAGPLLKFDDTNNYLAITGGNVGIGTTAPSSPIQVTGTQGINWPSGLATAVVGTFGTGGSLYVNTPCINSSWSCGFGVTGSYSEPHAIINLNAYGVNYGATYDSVLAFSVTKNGLHEAMRIDGSGNVGIGTTSPGARLQVIGIDSLNTSFAGNISGATGTGLVVTNAGNVGIGTTSPGYKLEVKQSDISDYFMVNSASTDTYIGFNGIGIGSPISSVTGLQLGSGKGVYLGSSLNYLVDDGSYNVTLSSNSSLNIKAPYSAIYVGHSNGAGYIQLKTGTSASPSAAVTINNLGNVGIGTTAPASRLTVKGTTADNTASALNVTDSNDDSKLYVRNDGNVGIGTTAPDAKLAINGTVKIKTQSLVASGSVTTANMKISKVAGTAFVDFSSSGTLTNYIGKKVVIKDAAGKALTGYIKAAGNGETYSEKIINGTFDVDGDYTGWTDHTNFVVAGGVASITNNGGGLLQTISAINYNGLVGALFTINVDATVTAGSLAFYRPDSATHHPYTWTKIWTTQTYPYWRIDAAANTTATIDNVSCKQTLTPSATGATITSTQGGSTYSWTSEESGFNPNSSSFTYEIYDDSFTTTDTGKVGIGTYNPGSMLSVAGGATFGAGYSGYTLSDGNVAIVGNLGIGTTAPASKLEVNGGDIRVTGGSFIDDGDLIVPDYVFEAEYNLLPIADLSTYITLNKHLPNVPDMNDRKGWASLSLQDRDMKLLEKVEENTLYTINNYNQIQTQQTQITGLVSSTSLLTDNQNKIVNQLANKLADTTLTVDQKLTLIGKNLDDLSTEQIKTIKDKITSVNNDISDITDRMTTIEDQVKKIQLLNSQEGIGLVETRLGDIEIALNVSGSDVNILGNLSVAGNIDLMNGKLTAQDVKVLGTMTAKNVEAEETVTGKAVTGESLTGKTVTGETLTGENLKLGKQTRGTGEIEAGENEVKIETSEVLEDVQIYITPLGKLNGRNLYVDMDEIKKGESFKVKLDGESLKESIKFNWLIIK